MKTLKAVARAALSSPAGTSPTGADGFLVPSNGVITFNLNRPPAEKKTEALQYQEATIRQSRGSKKPCFVSRVSCFVKTLQTVLPVWEAAVAKGERRIGGKLFSGLPALMLCKAGQGKD